MTAADPAAGPMNGTGQTTGRADGMGHAWAAGRLPPLLDGLVTAARTAPARPAVITTGREPLTFAQLTARVSAAAAGFTRLGMAGGTRTVVLVPPGHDFVVTIYGLLACGAVPVLLDPGIGVRRVRSAINEVRPQAFVGAARAHRARRLLRWAPSTDSLVVAGDARADRRRAGAGVVSLSFVEHLGHVTAGPDDSWTPQTDDHEAGLLFTSGSTGAPKAVVYRHGHFAAAVRALQASYGLTAGEVTVATFAPFALFGPAMGMTTVLPAIDYTRPASADPGHLYDVIAAYAADVLFASPTLLASLARHGRASGMSLPSLRLVLSAGAPVPAHVVAATAALVPPDAVVSTPYGMTEALPISVIAGDELRTTAALHDPPRGVCVGRPVTGTDATVIDAGHGVRDQIGPEDHLADGEVGELLVAGPQVTEAYAGRPDATALARTTWAGRHAHRTGDLAWRDGDGRLWFCGRMAHRVPTAAGALAPLPLEQLVLDHPAVQRAALVGVPWDADVRSPVLVVQYTADAAAGLRPWRRGARTRRAALLAELRARLDAHAHGAAVARILLRRHVPVDARHNAKIGYEQLARWATRRERRRPAWVGRRAFGGGRS